MKLEVRDPALAAIAAHVAARNSGVARLVGSPWLHGARIRARTRGVDVARHGDQIVLTVRLSAKRGRPVLDVVRTVQRSVRDEVQRLTGLTVEVVVTVVDLD